VQRAYAILKLEFKNPPSVAELANRVGLNESKLKKLFHEFFDDTIYGVLLKIRMELAYQMLEKDCRHISVVADMVGYGYLSNFSTAFSRYFGILPKSISKK
jgi:AraC-like DNA-binding protein